MALFLLISLATVAFSMWASSRVKSRYQRWSQVPARSGMTGAQAAAWILRKAGIGDVEIVAAGGQLVDHYDPINRRLVLSETNFHGHSVAALGIAAHEAGHAIQHQVRYAPLHWRMGAVRLQGIVSPLMWLPMIGIPMGLIAPYTGFLMLAIGMGVVMLFNLVTLPVEFDATRRAKQILTTGGLVEPGDEAKGMNAVLDAAALTYVAAFVSSLAWFLYYLLPLLAGSRNH